MTGGILDRGNLERLHRCTMFQFRGGGGIGYPADNKCKSHHHFIFSRSNG